MKIKCKIFLIILFMAYVLCACGDPEPEVYDEETLFMFERYTLRMDEKGRFWVSDFLSSSIGYVLQGHYYLYESKLVLEDKVGGIEKTIVLTADGDDWVFDQGQSKGVENLKFPMEDQAVWRHLGGTSETD